MNTQNIVQLELPLAPSVPTLSSSAVLVNLKIGSWSASKKDKAASAQVAHDNGVSDAKLARAYKTLVDSPKLTTLKTFVTRAHEINRTMTLDWAAGLRLCPTAQYFNHTRTLTGLKDEFDKLVDDFVFNDYDWLVTDMQMSLGKLYNAMEYPSASELRQKFYFEVQYLPVPDKNDFRVDLEHEAQDVLRAHYEKVYTDAVNGAMQGLWDRLFVALAGSEEKGDPGLVALLTGEEYTDTDGTKKTRRGRIYDTRVEGMLSLIDMLETLNITADPAMQRAQRRLKAAFEGITTKDDFKSDTVREEMRKNLNEVLASLPSFK